MSEWMAYAAWYILGIPGLYITLREGNPFMLALIALALGPIGTVIAVVRTTQ